jgi:hypothetical protein
VAEAAAAGEGLAVALSKKMTLLFKETPGARGIEECAADREVASEGVGRKWG